MAEILQVLSYNHKTPLTYILNIKVDEAYKTVIYQIG